MRAAVIHEQGGPEVVKVEQVADPTAGAGQVVVRVRACGVNRLDSYVRGGRSRNVPLPHIMGSEVAGDVAEVGPGVTGVTVGQRVAVHPYLHDGTCEFCLRGEETTCLRGDILGLVSDGGYAEYVRVPANSLVELPAELGYREAAALCLAALTAWHMLVTRAPIRPGETVLVQAAGSGVGSAAVQLAKLGGARVIATAGDDTKLARARELGADETINYATQDVVQEVRRLTAKRGVDLVVEHVGEPTWAASVSSLARNGRLVTCGSTVGEQGAVNIWALFAKQLQLIGAYGGTRGELHDLLRFAARGGIAATIDTVFPLEEIGETQRRLEARQNFGKMVVEP